MFLKGIVEIEVGVHMKKKLIHEYYKILSPDYPEWLDDYIKTKRLQHQKYISFTCGKIYSKLFDCQDYSSFDHSVGVALIIWHFTHDKKQTIAGLFHDIATPAFKHCIDFLNGDYITQESTEGATAIIIKNSKDILDLLQRDQIDVEDICDYHIYPVADNDIPMLSADRLEAVLSNDLIVLRTCDLDHIRRIYTDLEVQVNENGIVELGFKTKAIAREFVRDSSRIFVSFRNPANRFYMQAIADVFKKLSEDGLIFKKDLFEMKEKDVIEIIKKSKYKEAYYALVTATKVYSSIQKPEKVYFVHHGSKIRYIDPLFQGKRMSLVCKVSKKIIEKNNSYKMDDYVFLDDRLNVLKESE